MPVPSRLTRRLYETFGDAAGADMVDWMHKVEGQRAELRELNEFTTQRLEARLGEFEARIVGRVEAKIEQRFVDLMKWSLVFWIGAVGAIAVLARVIG